MSDDIRHATREGYGLGCKCDWCSAARRVWDRYRTVKSDEKKQQWGALLPDIERAYLAGEDIPDEARMKDTGRKKTAARASSFEAYLDKAIPFFEQRDEDTGSFEHTNRIAVYRRLREAL